MMKQFLIPTLAVALALITLVTTAKNINYWVSYTFCFVGNPYSQAEVEDLTNWVSTVSCTCTGQPNKACKIEVDDACTDVTNGIRVIKSSCTITSIPGSGGAVNGYVPDLTSSVGIVSKVDRQ